MRLVGRHGRPRLGHRHRPLRGCLRLGAAGLEEPNDSPDGRRDATQEGQSRDHQRLRLSADFHDLALGRIKSGREDLNPYTPTMRIVR